LRAGAPVIPAFTVRVGNGRKHKFIIERPLTLIRTGDISEDVAGNTQLFQSVIERYVRRYPEQWLWMQKRWKIRSYLRRRIEKKEARRGAASARAEQKA
jgi:KDO2-lipid IV(A) lauroyltransferase